MFVHVLPGYESSVTVSEYASFCFWVFPDFHSIYIAKYILMNTIYQTKSHMIGLDEVRLPTKK